MAVVSSWDGANRLIYIASGVTTFHPIDDIYREYRTARHLDESLRVWEPFMVAVGNDPKGGGRFTPRYLLLLDMHIVPFDTAGTLTVTGEVLVDDQSDPFDYSTLTNPMVVKYQPAEAELISVGTSGLTTEESQALISIAADQATISTNLAAQLVLVTGLSDMELARHITSPSLGKIVLRNPISMRRWEADAWEDEAMTIPYSGGGLEVADNLVEVAWS